jgi:cytochrome c553
MRPIIGWAIFVSASVMGIGPIHAAAPQGSEWAYADIYGDGAKRAPEDGKLYAIPGSPKRFTLSRIRGVSDTDEKVRVQPADWFPDDHPPMPKIVAEGDNVRGIVPCSVCHLPDGKGRVGAAPPVGQPVAYTVRQMHDFANGLRGSADPKKNNTKAMIAYAKAMTQDEIFAAAKYYASMKNTPYFRIVESQTMPKSRVEFGMWMPYEGADAGSESLGERVIEIAQRPFAASILRDPHVTYNLYAPIGSVAKGKVLVETGGDGVTKACTTCHGPDLHGKSDVPDIAARSPAYEARQLFDFQAGSRHGAKSAPMVPVAAKLTNEDIVDITAYLASLPPQSTVPLGSAVH